MDEMKSMQELRKENKRLREVVVMLMNARLVKELRDALERVNGGEYVSEEEFFKDSPQEDY
jgi:hypothetical protein